MSFPHTISKVCSVCNQNLSFVLECMLGFAKLFVGTDIGSQLFVLDTTLVNKLGNQGLGLLHSGNSLLGGGRFVHQSITSRKDSLEGSDQGRSLLDVSNSRIGIGVILDRLEDEVSGVSTVKVWLLVEGLDTAEGRLYLVGLELFDQFVEGGTED